MNLMVHPAAAVSAASALGFGLASQALGLWVGTAVGIVETIQRMAALEFGQDADGIDSFRDDVSPDVRARNAVRILKADAAATSSGTAQRSGSNIKLGARTPTASKKTGVRTAPGAKRASRAAADDLKAIGGIGPRLEQVLNGLGISTYAQIAALSAAEIADLDARLGIGGRIARDDWVSQAKKLVRRA